MKFKEYNLSSLADRTEFANVLVNRKLEISAHSISAHGQVIKVSMVDVPEQPPVRSISENNRVV